ncbi:MAG: sigma-E processing peptidase SpoIIGA [Oscillospiraceae bacterium]|nr:sigma-E processing peptidase SpoIIGA [Oscillospiraceae bacterium]
MQVYLDLIMLLNFLVDLLLLLGTNRLAGFPLRPGRAALAAGIGGVYGGICLLPGLHFLGNTLWRVVSLLIMSSVAFGWDRGALRRGVLFVLLSMALGGVALGLSSGGFWGLVLSAAAVCLMCIFGFRGRPGSREYVDVELNYGEKKEKLLALRDTGNTLRDPVTGGSVLVVSAAVAQRLLGLTKMQLLSPVETVAAGTIPGLRLIPYRCVSSTGGMLLALRLERVRIGNWQGSVLVAFAPEGLDSEGTYQALTGGAA